MSFSWWASHIPVDTQHITLFFHTCSVFFNCHNHTSCQFFRLYSCLHLNRVNKKLYVHRLSSANNREGKLGLVVSCPTPSPDEIPLSIFNPPMNMHANVRLVPVKDDIIQRLQRSRGFRVSWGCRVLCVERCSGWLRSLRCAQVVYEDSETLKIQSILVISCSGSHLSPASPNRGSPLTPLTSYVNRTFRHT